MICRQVDDTTSQKSEKRRRTLRTAGSSLASREGDSEGGVKV